MMEDTICLILGGGQGSRLFPLTKDRSKPAVPIGGKFRLIDIPISNCLNSQIFKILILTQFNSASLNQHVNQTYRFDHFHDGFVDILAAEQTMENADWYQGTADAVRKTIKHFTSFKNVKHVLILAGDQIYTMDFREMFAYHQKHGADVTIPVLPCNRHDAQGFGIVKMQDGMIKQFVEKPKEAALLDSLKTTDFIRQTFPSIEGDKEWLASMGLYLFNIDTLLELLDNNQKDFGKEVIPTAIETKRVAGYLFNGYWEDVGTIQSFWKANLDFATKAAPVRLLPEPDLHPRPVPPVEPVQRVPGRRVAGLRRHHPEQDQAQGNGHRHPGHRPGRRRHREVDHYGRRRVRVRGRAGRQPQEGHSRRGHRRRLGDPQRHHRQERPDRPELQDHEQGRQGPLRRRKLLHPRRNRGGAQGRRDPRRHRDLKCDTFPEGTLSAQEGVPL